MYEENPEESEVAADRMFLKRLCESSGGRILQPDELSGWARELAREQSAAEPKVILTSAWDRPVWYYLIGLLFGLEWYLRRRWGLC